MFAINWIFYNVFPNYLKLKQDKTLWSMASLSDTLYSAKESARGMDKCLQQTDHSFNQQKF